MKTRIFFLALQMVALALASPAQIQPNSVEQLETTLARAMDDLNQKDSIDIYGDMISLEKVAAQADSTEAEDTADPLISRIERFLRTRKIEIKLPNDGSPADYFGRALGEKKIDIELKALARAAPEARTKLKKIILPVLLALKLKALIILPIIITVIGLIGIKGLGMGMMALLLSGAVALKALLTPPPPPPYAARVSIVKPHEIHHDHWHRSQDEVNQPYSGWEQEYNPEQYPYQEVP